MPTVRKPKPPLETVKAAIIDLRRMKLKARDSFDVLDRILKFPVKKIFELMTNVLPENFDATFPEVYKKFRRVNPERVLWAHATMCPSPWAAAQGAETVPATCECQICERKMIVGSLGLRYQIGTAKGYICIPCFQKRK